MSATSAASTSAVPLDFVDAPPTFLSPGMPNSSELLAALHRGVQNATNVSLAYKAAFKLHLDSLLDSLVDLPSVPTSAGELADFGALKSDVAAILSKHKMPASAVDRLKMPSGSINAPMADLLFYPPWANRDSEVLVRGPDTTNRMIDAGVTCEKLFVHDLYSFSTRIPFGMPAADARPFVWDKMLNEGCAEPLWDVLTSSASSAYGQRAIKAGVDFVNGTPVKFMYKRIAQNLPVGWQVHGFSGQLVVPGITTAGGSFPAGLHVFEFWVFSRIVLERLDFGKISSFSGHPCLGGVDDLKMVSHYRNGAYTDAKLDFFTTYLHGERANIDRYTSSAWRARPSPPTRVSKPDFFTMSKYRAYEIEAGEATPKSELPEALVEWIDKTYGSDMDPSSTRSYLEEATSANWKRRMITMKATPADDGGEGSAWEAQYRRISITRRTVPSLADPSLSIGQHAANAAALYKVNTPSLENPLLNIAQNAGKKTGATSTSKLAPDGSGDTVAVARANSLAIAMRSQLVNDGSGRTKAQAGSVKGVEKRSKKRTATSQKHSETKRAKKEARMKRAAEAAIADSETDARDDTNTVTPTASTSTTIAAAEAPVERKMATYISVRCSPIPQEDAKHLAEFDLLVKAYMKEKDVTRTAATRPAFHALFKRVIGVTGREVMTTELMAQIEGLTPAQRDMRLGRHNKQPMTVGEIEWYSVGLLNGSIFRRP